MTEQPGRPGVQRYLMEGPGEADRLEAKTDAVETEKQLRLVGLTPGMRILDAGAGTGAVARVMARLVGETGAVVAIDGSAERLEAGRRLSMEPRLHFVASDLATLPFQEGTFDLVWSRFVFEYLADPDSVMKELVRVLKPGGILAVGDLDGNGLFHHPIAPALEESMRKLISALAGRFDPLAGRKLFHRFCKAGLNDIKVELLPYHVYAGAASAGALANWQQKLDGVAPVGRQVMGHAAYAEFSREFLAMLRNPETFTYSALVLVRGIKSEGITSRSV